MAPRRLSLLVLVALSPSGWVALVGVWFATRSASVLSRFGADGLASAASALALTRDVAARHAAWGVCLAIALWRSFPPDQPEHGVCDDRIPRWTAWIATWAWVVLSTGAGVVSGVAASLVISSSAFGSDIPTLWRNLAAIVRPQDLAVLALRSSVFALVVVLGAHAWRNRFGPPLGARQWQATLWRAGATCALLTLADLIPWWRLADDPAGRSAFPIDLATLW